MVGISDNSLRIIEQYNFVFVNSKFNKEEPTAFGFEHWDFDKLEAQGT